mgnify:CR=1 FL=1
MTRPEHYRSYSAVFPILLREGANGQEVLLHLRQNTGYMDGCWDFAGSGHVDENETARQAVARECLEELGITVNPADMEFVHLCHRVAGGDGRTYYDLCFIIRKYNGTPAGENRRTSLVPHGGPSGKYQYCRGGHAAPLSAGPALQ